MKNAPPGAFTPSGAGGETTATCIVKEKQRHVNHPQRSTRPPAHATVYDRAAALRQCADFEALVHVAYGTGLYASPEAARAVLSRLLTLGAANDPRQCEPAAEGYAVLYDNILLGHVWKATDAEPLWAAYEAWLRDEYYSLPLCIDGSLYEVAA